MYARVGSIGNTGLQKDLLYYGIAFVGGLLSLVEFLQLFLMGNQACKMSRMVSLFTVNGFFSLSCHISGSRDYEII